MDVTGYSNCFSVRAGGSIEFKVSCRSAEYRAGIVKLIHGDPHPDGPGFKAHPIPSHIDGLYEGKHQPLNRGSFICTEAHDALGVTGDFTLSLFVYPTLLGKRQAVISVASGTDGWALLIDEQGCLTFEVNRSAASLVLAEPVQQNQWHHVMLSYDAARGTVELLHIAQIAAVATDPVCRASIQHQMPALSEPMLILAARQRAGSDFPTEHFNGRIDHVVLVSERIVPGESLKSASLIKSVSKAPSILELDFSDPLGGDEIPDLSPNAIQSRAINMPLRGVRGYRWSGDHHDFTAAPQEYSAIHFHDDDLGDAGWDTSITLNVPEDLPSAVYALKLESEAGTDHIPFFVRPKRGAKTAKVAFLAPTHTYLAYGNEAIANREDMRDLLKAASIDGELSYPATPEDEYIVENKLLSAYDLHTDGTGVNYCSRLRPIINIRPDYYSPLSGFPEKPRGCPQQLGGDLYLIDWLEHHGYEYDVLTDGDIDAEGVAALDSYDVVLTGGHPEYTTMAMQQAFETYLSEGGRMMYLGGNGFYWVTSFNQDGSVLETRRDRGMRPWSNHPAETRHSTTGELGGLWKHRNRAPQKLFGVGTAAVGFDSGIGYAIDPDAREGETAFIFAGVDKDIVGDYPNMFWGNGAAGFEVDRAEKAFGTPSEARIVATARLLSNSFQQEIDEVESPGPHTGGEDNPNVRADMVYLPHQNGGAVFSVGSMLWMGALSYNNYDNSVSKVTANVLNEFLRRQ